MFSLDVNHCNAILTNAGMVGVKFSLLEIHCIYGEKGHTVQAGFLSI